MGTWSPRRATGWSSTPGLAVNDRGLVVEACRGPALRANSLTHHGGWYHRRSVSPAWQYVP